MGKPANIFFCRVCGLKHDVSPWGEDGKSPDYTFCACCGVEFGYPDFTPEGASAFRTKWINAGMNWDAPSMQPEGWVPTMQFANIPDDFVTQDSRNFMIEKGLMK